MRLLPHPLLGLCVLALCVLLAGCKTEENRPTYQQQTQVPSRVKAVQQAERKRWEAEQQAAREEAARAAESEQAAGARSPAGDPGASAAAAPAQSTGYLPPSEQGADVRVTETPVGAAPTTPASPAGAEAPGTAGAAPATSGQAPAGAAGGTGGQVPPGGPAGAAARPGGAAPPPPTGSVAGQAAPAGSVQTGLTATAPRTSAEQAAALNQDLQRKLREFDALMRQAQENAARERAAAEAAGAAEDMDGGRGGLLEAPPEGPGAGGRAGRATGLGSTPDLSGVEGAPSRRSAGRTEVALPDGGDDDIVARQLREAAERETDPVLQEKLWEEYRRYKGGL